MSKSGKITWQVPGSDVVHTIPAEAVVVFEKDGFKTKYWTSDNGFRWEDISYGFDKKGEQGDVDSEM